MVKEAPVGSCNILFLWGCIESQQWCSVNVFLWEVCRGGLEVWEQEHGFAWFDSLILPCWYLSSALVKGPTVDSCLSGFL